MADEPISCDPAVAALLIQLRRDLWRSSAPATLDGRIVDDATEKLGPLPDDLLAYCAGLGSMAMLLSDDEELDSFYKANENPDWRAGAQLGDFVSFDAWGEWPRTYAMYSPADRTFGVFELKTSTLTRVPSLAAVLASRVDVTRPPMPDELAAFRPTIHRGESKTRRVVHAKFGAGVVLTTLEGKLEIEFAPPHGIKVLAERFVKDE
jgi:hypothetical protein